MVPAISRVDPSGKWLYVANYGGGSVAEYPVHDDGSLGESSAFVQHAGSSANQAAPVRSARARDRTLAGRQDRSSSPISGWIEILSYKVGGLTPNDPPFTKIAPGSGPRHLAFTPDGKFAYVDDGNDRERGRLQICRRQVRGVADAAHRGDDART